MPYELLRTIQGPHDVSEQFIQYLKPLVGKLPVIGRLY